MSGTTPNKMAMCPSSVPGAVTKVRYTADGAEVTVTAPDWNAQRRIIALAELHEVAERPLFPKPHTGLRGGGARIGFCPIPHHLASVTTAIVPGGVRIHLRADSPALVRELQETVTARAARLQTSYPSS